MDPTKLAVGAGTAVLIAGGGYGVSTLFKGGMPDYFSLAAQTNKYTTDFPDYFVDIDHKDSSSWWTWVYNTRYWVGSDGKTIEEEARPAPKKAFENLKDAEGIKGACKKVYEADKAKVKSDNNPTNNDEFAEVDVWRYCTAIKKKPKTIQEQTGESYSTSGTYGQADPTKLISVESPDNTSFWKEQQRLFFKGGGNRSGSSLKNNSAFQDLYEGWKSGKSVKDDALKKTCKDAYGQPTTSSQNPNKYPEADVFRYCSLKRTKTS
ncbi:hypothetical protein [Candidatus Mycoplasma haematohominis]|uniref:Uncharacterized protein n=1 Tax=Candidatus Mycoplasma haematohominis TaxID=1494318 RepID=A0A478FR65_9MOLU|nr:hypothetical protein [Candidatus Mycoplasma haemohominis]GCE63647.1 hypothetical protein MHSWG343_06470 [Candidatus Mycoplasma haemohominis]